MIGVLVMAYGGPDTLEEVEPYLLDVRGHRPTAPEIVEEVRERYRRIGGRSPILEQTRAQAETLQAALDECGPGFKTFVGMRHWHPYIKNALADMRAQAVERAVGLVMAPHYSRMSIGAYQGKIGEAEAGIQFAHIQDWHLEPGYLETLAQRIREALLLFAPGRRASVPVLFTAHSLPQRILDWNDPYPAQLTETVSAVMERLEPRPHAFAYQSAAISSEPWLGPDAGTIIRQFAAQGQSDLLMCPMGFVSEHVEVLYDIDVVYRELAQSLGMHLERIQMPGTAPSMMRGLAARVRARAAEAGWI